MIYEDALRAAESMMDTLRPACQGFEPGGSLGSIAIAGSLRRQSKKEFDEIDLIMIPDLSPPPPARAEFGKPVPKVYKTKIEKILDEARESQKIVKTGGGDRSVKFYSLEHKIKLDLYLVRPPATWGVLFMIRTGPASFGHWIVTRRSGRAYDDILGHVTGGALPDGYRIQCGAVWEGEQKLPEKELLQKAPIGFDTEEGFLDFLGLGWIEPGERRARWGERRSEI